MAALNTYFPVASVRIRRALAIGALALAGSLAFTGLAQPGSAQAAPCVDEDLKPTRTTSTTQNNAILTRAENAVRCLINQERAKVGRPALAVHSALGLAARRHSTDMVARNYYSHTALAPAPNGAQPADRVRNAGYPGILRNENIAWGLGSLSTPKQVVQVMWMDPQWRYHTSPTNKHRDGILNPLSKEIGIGVAFGVPQTTCKQFATPAVCAGQGATYTADFGSR